MSESTAACGRCWTKACWKRFEDCWKRATAPELKPMQAVGYKQMAAHLLGACPLASAISEMERATRQYAKRQLTWFKGDPEFRWFQAEDREGIWEWIQRSG